MEKVKMKFKCGHQDSSTEECAERKLLVVAFFLISFFLSQKLIQKTGASDMRNRKKKAKEMRRRKV